MAIPMDFNSRRLKSQPLSSPCLKPGASRSFSGEYHLQITRWPQTTSIEIVVISGDEGYDSESRWSHSEIYRLTKMPHAEFDAQRGQ